MTESERRLAAIVSADVVGYSRLMAEDEDATVRTLTAYREQVGSLVREHRGRLVDFSGDNFLAEFPSALDAVRCAIEIQRVLAARNADLPLERKMEFRIGAHLGDIRVQGERIYGDGVNIAARLEGLAEAGGICISGAVCEQVQNKLPVPVEDLGEQTLKNIPHPVRVYRLRLGERREGAAASSAPRTASDKPSIAVLPFANMSGDPEQEYFADGITEDLITGLSKVSGLFVIARNSSFAYKGKSLDAKEIGRALEVNHLLEGSVRRAGDRVRITAQLVEAGTGHHLWAERYDRELKDIFALQDEVTEQIISALRVRLTESERARMKQRTTTNLEAYDLYLRGSSYLYQCSKASISNAREILERAVATDPKFAEAYSSLAMTYLLEWICGWSQKLDTNQRALDLAEKAVSLEDKRSIPHAHLAMSLALNGRHEEGVASARKAVRLSANYAYANATLGACLCAAGRPEEAIPVLEKALQLDPHDGFLRFYMGETRYLMGRLDEAILWLKRAAFSIPDFVHTHVCLAAAYAESGEVQKAIAEWNEVRRISPAYDIDVMRGRWFYKGSAMQERLYGALRKVVSV